jgi:hypothetical protein
VAERIVLRIGSAKKMSGKIQHTWNVICVKKFTYPMPKPIEFRVVSKTHLGASIKANNTIKKMNDGWIIKTVYWLDPNYL